MFAIIVAGVAGPVWAGRWFVVPSRRRDPDRDRWARPFLCGGMVGIRGSLTPFPEAAPNTARLQVGGAYRLVRHPILRRVDPHRPRWSLVSSALTLVVTVALMLVLEMKSQLEESMLAQRTGVRRVPDSGSAGDSFRGSTDGLGLELDGHSPAGVDPAEFQNAPRSGSVPPERAVHPAAALGALRHGEPAVSNR